MRFNWFRRNEDENTRLPHERYPELLDWQSNDELRSSKYYDGFTFYFISITENYIYMQDIFRHKRKLTIDVVMSCMTNISLNDRNVDNELKQTNEYKELLADFKSSVKELKNRYAN